MAQCRCYSAQNDTGTSHSFAYNDCNTGEVITSSVEANSIAYTCSLYYPIDINGGLLFQIMNNDSYCGGCECDCKTFIGFEYKGAGGVINITYTTCNNFTGTIINIPLSTSANSGGSYSTFIFADSVQFEDQPAFCAKVGTPITHTDVSGGIGGFIPLFGDCCAISYATFLVADCCEIKPDGYMSLPNTLTIGQVVGSSTDNNCYIIVDVAEAVPTLEWNNTEFDVLNGCQDCQLSNQYFCEQDLPTPTPTKTPTPTPTITPTITPSVTPTQTPRSSTIYFQKCCTPSQYLGVYNYNGLPISQNSSFSIKINNNTFCVKLISINPQNVVLYDYNSVELVSFNSCSDCYDEHPCPPAPSKQIMGYENECSVITIFPLELECKSINPSSITSNDGMVSVSITGGTPPYKYYWSGPGISEPNNNSAALEYVHIGDYTVTVVDFYGDFTATTVCTITAEKDCAFSGTVVEFIPPTPTPTPTQTKPPQVCDCKEGTIYISQSDLVASDDMTVYLSFTECTNSVQDFAKIIGGYPFTTSGQSDYNPCIDITTGAIVPSLFIMVDGLPQTLPSNADSYITLGNCCTPPPLLKNYSCVVGVCTLVGAGTGDYTSSNCDNQCGLTYKSWNVTYSFNTKCEQFDICSLQGSTILTVYTNSSVNSWNNGDSVYINSSLTTEIQAGRYYQNQGRLWSYGPTGLQCFCIIGNTPCSC